MGIYAPNMDRSDFMDKIYSDLGDTSGFDIIMLGHFNAVFDTKLDKSKTTSTGGFPKNFPYY